MPRSLDPFFRPETVAVVGAGATSTSRLGSIAASSTGSSSGMASGRVDEIA
jgi:hypothetical protein